jgi:SH3-like domain-containing protein
MPRGKGGQAVLTSIGACLILGQGVLGQAPLQHTTRPPLAKNKPPGQSTRKLSQRTSDFPFCGAIRTQKAEVRKGPGVEHPQICTLQNSAGWPVIVIRQSCNNWALISDIAGLRGWVKRARITRKPYVVVTKTVSGLTRPHAQAPMAAKLHPGVRAQWLAQEGSFVLVFLPSHRLRAWIPQTSCWPNTPYDTAFDLKDLPNLGKAECLGVRPPNLAPLHLKDPQ